jgi:hypothetical protein
VSGNDEAEKSAEKLTDATLSAAAMEETEDYLVRGRRFQRLSIEDLGQHWTNAIKAWVRDRSKEWQREFDDTQAELGLRGAEPPWSNIRNEIEVIEAEARRDMSEHFDQTGKAIEARIAELLFNRGRSSH